MAAGKARSRGPETKKKKKMRTKSGSVEKASGTQKPKATRKEKKAAFVTVGTTKFDQLIRQHNRQILERISMMWAPT